MTAVFDRALADGHFDRALMMLQAEPAAGGYARLAGALAAQTSAAFAPATQVMLDVSGISPRLARCLLIGKRDAQVHVWPDGEHGNIPYLSEQPSQALCGLRVVREEASHAARGSWAARADLQNCSRCQDKLERLNAPSPYGVLRQPVGTWVEETEEGGPYPPLRRQEHARLQTALTACLDTALQQLASAPAASPALVAGTGDRFAVVLGDRRGAPTLARQLRELPVAGYREQCLDLAAELAVDGGMRVLERELRYEEQAAYAEVAECDTSELADRLSLADWRELLDGLLAAEPYELSPEQAQIDRGLQFSEALRDRLADRCA